MKNDKYTSNPCHTWCGSACDCYPYSSLDLDLILGPNLLAVLKKEQTPMTINEWAKVCVQLVNNMLPPRLEEIGYDFEDMRKFRPLEAKKALNALYCNRLITKDQFFKIFDIIWYDFELWDAPFLVYYIKHKETIEKILDTNDDKYTAIIQKIISENQKIVDDMKSSGNFKMINFLVGKCMKEDKNLSAPIVKEKLESILR